MNNNLVFQNPSWYLLLILSIAIGYALFFYWKTQNLGQNLRIGLGILRGLIVFVILFLLLKPLLRTNDVTILKPIVVVGLDKSASIDLANVNEKSLVENLLNDLAEQLGDDKVELVFRDLEANAIDPTEKQTFNQKQTNFSDFFKGIEEEFSGQNLSKVVLISDGINNAGYLPTNKNFNYEINTIGLGDSTKQRDLAIKGITANKLAYLGNDFPIKVDLSANFFQGKQTKIRIKEGEKVLKEEVVDINNNAFFGEYEFILNATEAGIQQFKIEFIPLPGEKSLANNTRNVVIEVVDGKDKIMVLGLNPHPDLKTLKSILSKNELLDIEIFNIQSDDKEKIAAKEFDILILHQLPDIYNLGNDLVTKLLTKRKPTFFILGELSNLSRFNGMQEALGISASGSKTDKVIGVFDPSFKQFGIAEGSAELFAKLPPIIAPFGEYKAFPGTKNILVQKVGSLQTERTLLAINSSVARKTAVLAGEGLWKWRMEEFSLNKDHAYVDDLILKTIQLISLKENKDKLRVYPAISTFDIDETVKIQSEAYNNLLERIYDIDVTMELNGPQAYKNTFNYKIIEGNAVFELSKLKEGVYTYTASASILGNKETAKGQFVVTSKNLEMLNTTADFDLLRTLSKNTGGDFYLLNNTSGLLNKLTQNQVAGKVLNKENLQELINMRWVLFLLILLLAIEWIARKYKGIY